MTQGDIHRAAPPARLAALASLIVLVGCGSRAPVAPLAADRVAQATAPPRQASARTSTCGGHAPAEHVIRRRRWLTGVQITEYYPVPERWFVGSTMHAPGLPGRHRVDWLYSARGVSMEGDGIDAQGHRAHIADLGNAGWVSARGRATRPPRCGAAWSTGAPVWRAGGWRNRGGAVTFPLGSGGWSDGPGHPVGGYGGATFAPGPSLPLHYYRSVAVDPHLIARGSRLYIPAYRAIGGGWFLAQDTGGAILGRHIDVYRPPPATPTDTGRSFGAARVLVIPPGS